MIFTDEQKQVLDAKFRAIYTNKSEAKELSSRNTEIFKSVFEMFGNVEGMNKKTIKLAYKTWEEQFVEQPTDLLQANEIAEQLINK